MINKNDFNEIKEFIQACIDANDRSENYTKVYEYNKYISYRIVVNTGRDYFIEITDETLNNFRYIKGEKISSQYDITPYFMGDIIDCLEYIEKVRKAKLLLF